MVNDKGASVTSVPDAPYYQKYIQWVSGILTASDKFEQFKRLLTFPLKTNEVVDDIADEYTKVFDAQDSFFIPELSDPDLVEDFNQYIGKLSDSDFWHNDAFKAMMSNISSILVVDLPDSQTSQTPEPYYYLLDIRKVVDVQVSANGDIEYLIFKTGKNTYGVFDSLFFRVYKKEDEYYALLTENEHDLGYCPARFLWSDVLSKNEPIVKHAPISALLSRLDWYLFFETAKESLDIYAAYPLYWAYQSKCDYKDQFGNDCHNGLIKIWDESKQKDVVYPCPVCESKKIVGPGSLIEKPIPRGDIKIDGEPAGIIGVDEASLTYNVNEAERLKAQIITAATGKNKLLNKQAINQDQVSSQFESQTNVLRWIADNFSKSHRWTWNTLGKLRYGDNYVGCSISYGSEFYLQTLAEVVNDFKNGKDSGLPEYILLSKISAIEHLQSKNNPKEKARINILRHLEPFPYRTLKECKELGFDVIDKHGFVLKANFANFVNKFERDFGSLIDFGSALDFSTRIERIAQKLNEYADVIVSKDNNVTGGELGKLPLAIQQLSLAMFRADQSGNKEEAELLKTKIKELTESI